MKENIALIGGPFLSPDGVEPWNQLHKMGELNITAFESNPSRFDTSNLEMPVRQLNWPDGQFKFMGYNHFLSRAARKAHFPSNFLRGVRNITDEFDAIHVVENYHIFSLQAALATSGDQTTEFFFSAGENIPYPLIQRNPIQWWMKKYVNSKADKINATTPQAKRALIHEGVPHSKVSVVPNSIDTSVFSPEENSQSVALDLPNDIDDTLNILFVHKLNEQKGVPYIVEAFKKLDVEKDVRLILVGESKLSRKDQIMVNSNPSILWKEKIPYERMPDIYNLSDIFVLPSVTMANNEEQFGVAVLEAMACGLPTIVTDVGGLPYVTEVGETSMKVNERDSDELAEAFKKLIKSKKLREEMGQAGRKRAVEEFGSKTVAKELLNFYQSALSD